MKYNALKCMIFLLLMSVSTFQASSVGLQEYLQNTEQGSEQNIKADTESVPVVNESTTKTDIVGSAATQSNDAILKILELVVAGIVASALIISLLVLFLGRWLARRDKSLIQKFRIEAEQNVNHITSATSTIREQEKETTQLIHDIKEHESEFSSQKAIIDSQNKEIEKTSAKINKQEQELSQLSDKVTKRIGEIQSRWDEQLKETVSSTQKLQKDLDKNLNVVTDGIVKMQQQKDLSQDLLQEFLDQHSQQSKLLQENSELSIKVNDKLEESYEASKKLIKLLNKNQDKVERSLTNFTEKLTGYEEQAYEQFDTSFQVADLARQELTANIEESRNHVETMRRQEVQSHSLNSQTMKNLETLDYSKIVKISNTLDTTQDMFNEMHSKIEETRSMLDELKEIETDIKKTASEVESAVKVKNTGEELTVSETPENEDVLTDLIGEKPVDIEKETTIEKLSAPVVAAQILDNLSDEVEIESKEDSEEEEDNSTIALTDYKMTSGNNPVPFFRNLKHK